MIKTGILIKNIDAYLNIYQDGSFTMIGLRDVNNKYLSPYNLLYIVGGVMKHTGGVGSVVDTWEGRLIIDGVDLL